MRIDQEKVSVALTPTCPSINKVPREKIIEFLNAGLGEKILKYAELNPDIIKENSEFFLVLQ